MNISIPILVLGGLGIVFGVGLAIASKKFCIVIDPRITEVFSHLPGANCGACGFPGCMAFAEGLIQGTCTVEKCAVSNEEKRLAIGKILGIEVKAKVRRVAVLHCSGGKNRVKDKFIYKGITDCLSANLVMQGPRACVYGCIGFGSCLEVCPFDAISMNKENLPVVNEDKCRACGKCVAICPKKLFTLTAISKDYAVRCRSLDFGKKVMDVCKVGCIGCRKCEKACPIQAIKITDNLAVIDYNLCDNRGECFKACPTGAIAKKENKIWRGK